VACIIATNGTLPDDDLRFEICGKRNGLFGSLLSRSFKTARLGMRRPKSAVASERGLFQQGFLLLLFARIGSRQNFQEPELNNSWLKNAARWMTFKSDCGAVSNPALKAKASAEKVSPNRSSKSVAASTSGLFCKLRSPKITAY
jgi:hypothetical protein